MGHLVPLKLAFNAEDAFDCCRATRSRSELGADALRARLPRCPLEQVNEGDFAISFGIIASGLAFTCLRLWR
jgi:hypothetical protein